MILASPPTIAPPIESATGTGLAPPAAAGIMAQVLDKHPTFTSKDAGAVFQIATQGDRIPLSVSDALRAADALETVRSGPPRTTVRLFDSGLASQALERVPSTDDVYWTDSARWAITRVLDEDS